MQGDVGQAWPSACEAGAADLKTTWPTDGAQDMAVQPSAPPPHHHPGRLKQSRAGSSRPGTARGTMLRRQGQHRGRRPTGPALLGAATVPQPGSGRAGCSPASVHVPLPSSPGFRRILWCMAAPP